MIRDSRRKPAGQIARFNARSARTCPPRMNCFGGLSRGTRTMQCSRDDFRPIEQDNINQCNGFSLVGEDQHVEEKEWLYSSSC